MSKQKPKGVGDVKITQKLEACAVANECGGKVYELGLIKVR